MALTYCPDCNHQVSDRAESCPSCGARLHEKEIKTQPIGVLATLGVIAGLVVIYFILTFNPTA